MVNSPCEVLEEAGTLRGDHPRSYAADTSLGDGLQRHEQFEIVWKMVDESQITIFSRQIIIFTIKWATFHSYLKQPDAPKLQLQ